MTIKTKMTTEDIRQTISADKCNLRNGIYKAKWMYFYTHGLTIDDYVAKVHNSFPGVVITKQSNHWNSWPKDSWFEICFTIWPG